MFFMSTDMAGFQNQLAPEIFEDFCIRILEAQDYHALQDLHAELQGMLTDVLTMGQLIRIQQGMIGQELGPRMLEISAGMSPLHLVDEVIGRRFVRELDAMGYHGRNVVIYDAQGARNEISVSCALGLLHACRQTDMPSIISLVGVEILPGATMPSLFTFPIIELHRLFVGPGAPPVEAISPTITTGRYVQVPVMCMTMAARVSQTVGPSALLGHVGVREKLREGVSVEIGLPGQWRRGCSCSDNEAAAWAEENFINGPQYCAPYPPGFKLPDGKSPPGGCRSMGSRQDRVFLSRVVDFAPRCGRFPVLSTPPPSGDSNPPRGADAGAGRPISSRPKGRGRGGRESNGGGCGCGCGILEGG